MISFKREMYSVSDSRRVLSESVYSVRWRQKVKRLTGLVRNALVLSSAVQHVEMSGLFRFSVSFLSEPLIVLPLGVRGGLRANASVPYRSDRCCEEHLYAIMCTVRRKNTVCEYCRRWLDFALRVVARSTGDRALTKCPSCLRLII